MKLLLTSKGFETPDIVQACVDLCEKPKDEIRFGIINEAYANDMYCSNRWVIQDLGDFAEAFKGPLFFINLRAHTQENIAKRINDLDALFILGGQEDYLMNLFEETGFTHTLKQALKTKVCVGQSSGGMILGHKLPRASYAEMYNEPAEVVADTFMELVDIAVIPHMDSGYEGCALDNLKKLCAAPKVDTYALSDESAIVVRDQNITVIGPYHKFQAQRS